MDLQKYFSTHGIKGNIQQAIAEGTANALQYFCNQEQEFAQAIEQSGKTFQECLDYVAKGVGRSISDLDAYTKAVEFYFSGAKVQFCMKIDLVGENADTSEPPTPKKITVSFNSGDFLNF